MDKAKGILNNFYFPNIDKDWLSDCVDYIQESNPLNFDQEFTTQILFTNIKDLVSESSLVLTHEIIGAYFLQIVDIKEIGISTQTLLDDLKNNKALSRKLLKFKLSDGIKEFYAVENQLISQLSLLTPLGSKVILSGGKIYNGMVLLEPDYFSLIGGSVTELNKITNERLASEFQATLKIPLVAINSTSRRQTPLVAQIAPAREQQQRHIEPLSTYGRIEPNIYERRNQNISRTQSGPSTTEKDAIITNYLDGVDISIFEDDILDETMQHDCVDAFEQQYLEENEILNEFSHSADGVFGNPADIHHLDAEPEEPDFHDESKELDQYDDPDLDLELIAGKSSLKVYSIQEFKSLSKPGTFNIISQKIQGLKKLQIKNGYSMNFIISDSQDQIEISLGNEYIQNFLEIPAHQLKINLSDERKEVAVQKTRALYAHLKGFVGTIEVRVEEIGRVPEFCALHM